ncbi:hypothetical protein ACVR0P_08880 [Streptococcus castoreus]|uniref:hypothetical protein n=1 Tax=Streptococcus castoreus TaxID=254786 RepID=UPI000422E7E6|nr:hypothetical protein [Streptococcus castoreus]
MANENNLIPIRKRSSKEAREMGKKGGIASGKVRRKKANLKKAFDTLLASEVANDDMKAFLTEQGFEPSNEMALAMVVLQKALRGDAKALAQIMDILEYH